jgi:hypothetical protein
MATDRVATQGLDLTKFKKSGSCTPNFPSLGASEFARHSSLSGLCALSLQSAAGAP